MGRRWRLVKVGPAPQITSIGYMSKSLFSPESCCSVGAAQTVWSRHLLFLPFTAEGQRWMENILNDKCAMFHFGFESRACREPDVLLSCIKDETNVRGWDNYCLKANTCWYATNHRKAWTATNMHLQHLLTNTRVLDNSGKSSPLPWPTTPIVAKMWTGCHGECSGRPQAFEPTTKRCNYQHPVGVWRTEERLQMTRLWIGRVKGAPLRRRHLNNKRR